MELVKKIPASVRYGVLTGILVGTSYIPFPPWALLFSLAPLWYFWRQTHNLKQIFISGWVAQFVLTLIGFHWIAHTVVEFGHLPWPVGIAAVLAYASFSSLYFPLAGVLAHLLTKNRPRGFGFLLLLAGLTALLERITPSIFPWNMGYPWYYSGLNIAQNAEGIGFFGLSFITLLICALITQTFFTRSLIPKILAVAIFVSLIVSGTWLKNRLPEPDRSINVLMVQANIGNFEKYAAERNSDFRLPIVTKFFELTNIGLQKFPQSQLVFWPETAFPSNLHPLQSGSYYQVLLRDYVAQKELPLITGGYLDEPDGRYFNSLFYLDKSGFVTGRYDKHMLLAFGEYFPGSDYFPFLKKLVPAVSDFGRGVGPGILYHQDLKLGSQICYEGLFDSFSRDLANQGAQILMNVTNDSWFGHFFESRQHMYMTLARAIEFRLPLVRVTNTGISAAVDAKGTFLIESPQETEWSGMVKVPYSSSPTQTLYAGFGYWLSWLMAILAVLGGLAIDLRKKK